MRLLIAKPTAVRNPVFREYTKELRIISAIAGPGVNHLKAWISRIEPIKA
jgi:hypothetical protein